MLNRTRPRALAWGCAVLFVVAGCSVTSTGTVTVDGSSRRATSVRCTVVGYDNTIDLRTPGGTARVVVRDQMLAEAVEVRVAEDGRAAWVASTERGLGTTATTREGLRFMVNAEVVEVDGRGAPTGQGGVRPVSIDVTCAQLH
ncbi:lipoprotein LpqH [Mariniluteicoccus endophyticus]